MLEEVFEFEVSACSSMAKAWSDEIMLLPFLNSPPSLMPLRTCLSRRPPPSSIDWQKSSLVSTLQHTLQHTTTRCNTLQHAATLCITRTEQRSSAVN